MKRVASRQRHNARRRSRAGSETTKGVIPAHAGIQSDLDQSLAGAILLDPRLRGDDGARDPRLRG
ncbi:MAG: hypothetical protein WD737_09165, partial [Gemmatimonadota bacterium]